MRFFALLAASLPFLASAQDLNSILSAASAEVSDLLTQSDVQSAISEASSLVNNPSFTSSIGQEIASLTSQYSSDIASITSQYGTDLASYTSALGSFASSAIASATANAGGDSGSGVDKVAMPAMGVVGAGILGLAAFL